MKVREVIQEYHTKVPFPWSLDKIKKAGYSPVKLIARLVDELEQCEDDDDLLLATIVEMIAKS